MKNGKRKKKKKTKILLTKLEILQLIIILKIFN